MALGLPGRGSPVAPRMMRPFSARPTMPGEPLPPRLMAQPFSFKRGGQVKRTGLALVHQGETILPKPQQAVPTRNPQLQALEKKLSKKGKKPVTASLGMERIPNGEA